MTRKYNIGLPTMREIKAWARQPVPETEGCARAEIVIDQEKRRIGCPEAYKLYYHFDPIGDGVPWMVSCYVDMQSLKSMCAKLMSKEVGHD